MARKRKLAHESPAPSPDGPKKRVAMKQKVDWSTMEEFEGFNVSLMNIKTLKKPTTPLEKKQTGVVGETQHYPSQDAPLDADIVQPNPYPEAELSEVHVRISPALHWESTHRYRRFTINGEEFQVGQVVFVKNSEGIKDTNSPDALQGWLAKILEVRAGDASHVYLRVFWAYRPEDLPGGRQPHHGSSEVIVSNHMDIIEALSVQASVDVGYWSDDPDSLPLPADQLFFRQSFDITKKRNPLSKLNMYCVDKQPINPDQLLVQCSHCSEWLHAQCLEQQAIRNTAAQHKAISPLPKNKGRPGKAAKANGDDLASKFGFAAKLSASATSNLRLTITDNRTFEKKRQWHVDIMCPMCEKVIEKAEGPGVTAARAQENENVSRKEDEEDSVIGDPGPEQDAQTESASSDDDAAPTSPAIAKKASHGRGRPPGSIKKRKRTFPSSATKSIPLQAQHISAFIAKDKEVEQVQVDQQQAPPEMLQQNSPNTPPVTSTATAKIAPMFHPVTNTVMTFTPPATAPVSESILQSGVRSVKQLLWRA